jgi:hypothetical protein
VLFLCSRDTLLPTSLPFILTHCTLPDVFDEVLGAPSVPQKPVHGGDGPTASDLPPVPPTCLTSTSSLQDTSFHLSLLLLLCLHHLLLYLHHSLLHPLAPSTSDPQICGCQSSGLSQSITSSLGDPQMTIPVILCQNATYKGPLKTRGLQSRI